MCAMIVARSGLSFTIGFHQETAEVGDDTVDFLCLSLPPLTHTLVFWISGACIAKCHWCGEIDREIDANAVRAQQIGNLSDLVEVFTRQHLRRSVDIVEHRTIDADRGIGACILMKQCFIEVEPLEDTLSCIATFDASVKIVPVVEHSQTKPWVLFHVVHVALCGLTTQYVVSAIEQTDVASGTYHDTVFIAIDGKTLVVCKGRVDE